MPRIDSDFQESNVLGVADIYKQVRGCVRKWMNEQKDDCHDLQEGKDFTLNVASNRKSGKVNVSIMCLLCGTQLTIHQVKNTFICSNFYRHVTPCVEKRNAENESKPKFIQPALNQYFSKPNARQGNTVSNVPPNEASHQHFVDLTSTNVSSPRLLNDVESEYTSTESSSSKNQVF